MAAWLLTMALLRGADAATTIQAFHHGRVEAVPWMPHTTPGVVVGQAAILTAEVLTAKALDTQGHHTWARVVCSLSIGSASVGVVINLRGSARP